MSAIGVAVDDRQSSGPAWGLDASEATEAVRTGRLSSEELVASHLERVAHVNDDLNALVEVRDGELLNADAASARARRARGEDLPLEGVVVSVKDHHDVEGLTHTEGLRAFAGRVSPADSVAVRRLRQAGALVIGKSNQPDLQTRWNTISDLYGATRNPRDLALSAGGSSGGDAAVVASGMAALGLGGDFGGSLRVPAAFCGVWALRPSAGRVPSVNVLGPPQRPHALDLMASTGPLARSLADLEQAFRVLAGPDPADAATVPLPPSWPEAASQPGRVARISTETGAVVAPEIEAELDMVCRALEEAGYSVEPEAFPSATRGTELWAEIVGAELRHADPTAPELMGPSGADHIRKLVAPWDLGEHVAALVRAYMERDALVRSTATWMEGFPVVVAPIAGMSTPALDFDDFLSLEDTGRLFDRMRNVMWVNLLGLPSVALPNGIQIVARRFHEADAFAAAAAVEAHLDRVTPMFSGDG